MICRKIVQDESNLKKILARVKKNEFE